MRSVVATLCLVLVACPKAVRGQDPGAEAPRTAERSPAADEALSKALVVADSGPRADGVAALLAVHQKFPSTVAGQEALYRAGVMAFDDGDFQAARQRLNQLVFENPLHERAKDARLKSGLAALELKQHRDAYQTLQPLVESLGGEERRLAEDALAQAAAATQQYGEALKLGLKAVEGAQGPELQQALARLEDVVETKTPFIALAEAWNGLPTSNPAWPLLTFKMARVYFHLRDWPRLDDTLKQLLATAPGSPYAAEAKALQARVARRAQVRPRALGAVLPLTGKLKPVGEAVQRSLTLALKGSDLELVVKDSQGDASLAAKHVEALALEEGVMAIVGPLSPDETKRAALVAEELQVPLITLSKAEDVTKVGPHVFRTMVTSEQQASALADYAMGTLGYKSFAVLYPNISFGAEMSNAFWDAVESRGGEIRGAETYEHDQTTFTTEAKKLVGRYFLEDRYDYYEKLKDLREGLENADDRRRRHALEKARDAVDPIIDFEALFIPDLWSKVALVAPALAVEEVVTNACDKKDIERIQKTTGKQKLKTVTLLGPATWSSPKGASGDPQLIERGGKYVLCSVFVDGFYENSDRPQTKAYVQAFRELYKDAQLTLVDAVAYDTGGLLRAVMERQPKSRAQVREALAGTKAYEGATGTISFDEQREAQRPLFLLNVTPKGIREIERKPPQG